jgi:hypothetical protein
MNQLSLRNIAGSQMEKATLSIVIFVAKCSGKEDSQKFTIVLLWTPIGRTPSKLFKRPTLSNQGQDKRYVLLSTKLFLITKHCQYRYFCYCSLRLFLDYSYKLKLRFIDCSSTSMFVNTNTFLRTNQIATSYSNYVKIRV